MAKYDYASPMICETLSIKVSKAEKNLLRQAALARKTTASDLLRKALHQVMRGTAGHAPSLMDKHRHLMHSLDRGPGDLSTNPDRMRGFGR